MNGMDKVINYPMSFKNENTEMKISGNNVKIQEVYLKKTVRLSYAIQETG